MNEAIEMENALLGRSKLLQPGEWYKKVRGSARSCHHHQPSVFCIKTSRHLPPADFSTMWSLCLLLLGLTSSLVNAQLESSPQDDKYGSFMIVNNCTFPVYAKVVGDQTYAVEQSPIFPKSAYSHDMFKRDNDGGITVFLSREPDADVKGQSVLELAYTVVDETQTVWYELTTENGSPFEGYEVWLGRGVPEIYWPGGVKPEGDHVQNSYVVSYPWLNLCGGPFYGLLSRGD
jgi:hypothetical protein